MERWHFGLGLVLCLILGATDVRAEYPERPITLIVPFAAGGANDSVARQLANKLGPALGQAVVVENRSGGGTVIGSAAVARSKADGYTVLLVSAAHTIPIFSRISHTTHCKTSRRSANSRGQPTSW
jgi:tripartite-type tricarboxylate transporter receptor subunit TctC